MNASLKNAVEIWNKGGVVAVSEWTRGSGNYVSARPVPVGCYKFDLDAILTRPEYGWTFQNPKARQLSDSVIARLRAFRKARPRVQRIICVVDEPLILSALPKN